MTHFRHVDFSPVCSVVFTGLLERRWRETSSAFQIKNLTRPVKRATRTSLNRAIEFAKTRPRTWRGLRFSPGGYNHGSECGYSPF